MKKSSLNKKKIISTLAVAFFIVTGTYNAVVINSESGIDSDVKFVKRLDEIYGVTTQGRVVAASASWQKLSKEEVAQYAPTKKTIVATKLVAVSTSNNQVSEAPSEASVQEDLSLNLVEVINPKKYAQGLGTDKFQGSLQTNNGVIESLNVALPNGEGVSVSFSEMTGNVFEYDYNGEVFSGMMYQVDQASYVVTLTNGPLEGTRLRFNANSEESVQEANNQLAENHGMNVGNFGEEVVAQSEQAQPEVMVENNEEVQNVDQNYQAQGFNFESQQAM